MTDDLLNTVRACEERQGKHAEIWKRVGDRIELIQKERDYFIQQRDYFYRQYVRKCEHEFEVRNLNEKLEAALTGAEAWIDRWTKHVGSCAGGSVCGCGRTLVLYEASAALGEKKDGN